MKRELIGHCTVDSGQLAIVDPCYILDGQAYDQARLGDESCKTHIFEPPYGAGVVFTAGGGDGQRNVFVEFEDDRPRQIVIELE